MLTDAKKRFVHAVIDDSAVPESNAVITEVERWFQVRIYIWQAFVIQALLAGLDVMVRAGTGSGKSIVFQALAVAKLDNPNAIVLVISPILALMKNQVALF
jgi:superfamily II DNA helicase RecQ